MTKVIILLNHEICRHRMIYNIGLLGLIILSPSLVVKSMTHDPLGHHCCLRIIQGKLSEQTLGSYHFYYFFHVPVRGTT